MSPHVHLTVKLAAELRSGRNYGVFIDDTGSPGLKTPGLDERRKSWVAALVPPHEIAEVMNQLPNSLAFLKELELDNPEIHFTDIWAGKGEYKKKTLQQRLGIFRFMAYIFASYRFPILVQTFTPDTATDMLARADLPVEFRSS